MATCTILESARKKNWLFFINSDTYLWATDLHKCYFSGISFPLRPRKFDGTPVITAPLFMGSAVSPRGLIYDGQGNLLARRC